MTYMDCNEFAGFGFGDCYLLVGRHWFCGFCMVLGIVCHRLKTTFYFLLKTHFGRCSYLVLS